jgi:WD40 repeat protein
MQGFALLDSDQVIALSFAPNSQLLAGGCMDHKVRLWDMSVNKLKATLEGPKDIVRSVAFSPDGKTVVAGADDGTIYLWDVATEKLNQELKGPPSFVNGLVFLSENKLAAVTNDITHGGINPGRCRIKIWDIQKNQARTLHEQAGSAYGLACSPDGKLLAATLNGSFEAKAFHGLKVWDLAAGKVLWEQAAETDFMTSVVFAPDGKTLAVGGGHAIDTGNGWRTEARLWMLDVQTQKPLWRAAEAGNGCFGALAFTADGKGLLTGSSGPIREFNPGGAKGQKVVSELRRLEPATGKVVWKTEAELGSFTGVGAAADGKTLAGADDDQFMLFDPDTGLMREVLLKRTLTPRPPKASDK